MASSTASLHPVSLLAPRPDATSPRTVTAVTAANVVLGAAAVVVSTLVFPVHQAIAAPAALPGVDPRVMGIALWAVVCQAAALLPTVDRLVFSTGSILGAALLGGPTAAVWVALLGTFDLRELRLRIPLRGIASNHGQMAWSAFAAAVVLLWIRPLTGVANEAVDLVAMLVGALVFNAANQATTLLVDHARTGRAAREAFDVLRLLDWNQWAFVETAVAFLCAVAYLGGAWWAPAVLIALDAAVSRSVAHHRSTWKMKHHPITGLPNAQGLAEHARAVAREVPPPTSARVLYVDLDGFKQVNDMCGHATGDEVLKTVASRLADVSRREAFVAHLHGDEFAVLVLGAGEDDCVRLGKELRKIVERRIPALDKEHVRISASSGHAPVTDLDDLREAMRAADAMMQANKTARAKAEGRERRTS